MFIRRLPRPAWRRAGQGAAGTAVLVTVVLAVGTATPASTPPSVPPRPPDISASDRLGFAGVAPARGVETDAVGSSSLLPAVATSAEEVAVVIDGAIEEAVATTGGDPASGGLGSEPAARTEAAPHSGTGSVAESVPIVALVQAGDGSLEIERRAVSDSAGVDALASELTSEGTSVVAVGVDRLVVVDDPVEAVGDVTAQAADAYRELQWALDRVPFEGAWGESRGTAVTVAVIDTAIDTAHPDLAGQLLPAYHFLATGSGPGFATPHPGNFHGTHVAGIVAALAGNGIGIAGGAPGAAILPVEVLDATGAGRYSDIVAGIVYAVDHGAGVINLSLGGPSAFAPLDAAIAYAESHGVVVLAAAGNDGCTVGIDAGCSTNYPAASTYAVAVGSVDSDLGCSSFTTRAGYVALGAPGRSILSTYYSTSTASSYAYASGTSMATPYASAAAAIVRGAHPGLSAAAVRDVLVATAFDVGEAGRDMCTGEGLVDPLAALDALAGPGTSVPPADPSGSTPQGPGPARLAGVLGARGMVRLSFVAPPGTVLLKIYRDGQLIASIDSVRRSYTDRDVSPRTTYGYEVVAWSPAFGAAPSSGVKQATTRG